MKVIQKFAYQNIQKLINNNNLEILRMTHLPDRYDIFTKTIMPRKFYLKIKIEQHKFNEFN